MLQNNNEQLNISGAVEAVLFAYGEPMEIKKISKIVGVEEKLIKSSLDDLTKIYEEGNRGLKLIFSLETVQLVTKPEFSIFLENFIKEEFKEELTPASLETLSLIIYLGPISRPQIDYYRGVNSSFTLRSILLRGLVERFPDPDKGNIYFYKPSFDSLKHLGISKVEDLPNYQEFRSVLSQKEEDSVLNPIQSLDN